MKILTVVGARPQFIKCGPVSRELRTRHQEILVHTGQHYDYMMNKIFFEELDIPTPDYNLEIGSGSHSYQTAEIMKRLEPLLLREKPDLVLVYGDTNSTLAGAITAAKMNIELAHVEAGLRSYDNTMPEETNRVLTDHISDLLFCPTQTAVDNLAKEGITSGVYFTGDVMVDALLYAKQKSYRSKIMDTLGLNIGEYLLATIHRAANTDNKQNLENIVNAFYQIEEEIILPCHPRTLKQLQYFDLHNKLSAKVRIIEPLGYLDFIHLLSNARKVITDSGGLQKEAYILKVPCITLRENTEWPETLENGWNKLVGCDTSKIVAAINIPQPPKVYSCTFVNGASANIVELLNE